MALRAYRYWMLRYRRTWRGTIVISVANPLLFLVAIGAGLGRLVGPDAAALGGVDLSGVLRPRDAGRRGDAERLHRVRVPGGGQPAPGRRLPGRRGAPRWSPTDILHGHLLFMAFRVATERRGVPGGDGRVRRGALAAGRCWPCPRPLLTGDGLRAAGRGVGGDAAGQSDR